MSHGAVYYETEISGVRALGKDPIRGFEISAQAPRNADYDLIKIPVPVADNQPFPTINDELVVSVVWQTPPDNQSSVVAGTGGGGGYGGAGDKGRFGGYGGATPPEGQLVPRGENDPVYGGYGGSGGLMDNPNPMDNPKPKAKVTFVVQFRSDSGEVTHTYKETRTVEDGDEFMVSLPNDHYPPPPIRI